MIRKSKAAQEKMLAPLHTKAVGQKRKSVQPQDTIRRMRIDAQIVELNPPKACSLMPSLRGDLHHCRHGRTVVVRKIEKPVVIKEIEQPVRVKDIDKPVIVKEIEKPVTVKDIEQSVTVNPVTVKGIENPVTVQSIESPVAVQGIETPVTVNEIQAPVTIDSIVEPVAIQPLTQYADKITVFGSNSSLPIQTDAEGRLVITGQFSISPVVFTQQQFTGIVTAEVIEYLPSQDVSIQTNLSYSIINRSSNPAIIQLQISPNNVDYAVDTETTVVGLAMQTITPLRFLRYARIAYQSAVAGNSATIDVYYQAQSG